MSGDSLDPADAPKEHERCGSNLIAPLLILSVAGQLATERLFRRPGPLPRAVAARGERLGGGGALRIRRAAARLAARAGRSTAIGHEIQRVFSTREPTGEQLEVGSAALREILRAEASLAGDVQPQAGTADTL